MSRRSALFIAALLVVLQIGNALPANAATLTFTDAKGDATGFVVESTPRPSDPELDILAVSFRTTADTLFVVAKFDKLGTPQLATGATRTINFTYDEADYEFRYQSPAPPQDQVSATGFFFRDSLGMSIPCGRCSGKLDLKAATLSITAPFSSMSAGIKTSKATSPAIKPGVKFSNLNAESLRTISLEGFSADVAAAKPETVFVL